MGGMAGNIRSHVGPCPTPRGDYLIAMELLELLWWAFMAVVKFVVTPSLMVARGMSWWLAWSTTSFGAVVGVWGIWHFGKWWFAWFEERLGPRVDRGKRTFTRRRRTIVRWKNAMGLSGLLALSGLISVPVATVLAAKYFRHQPGTMWKLMAAFSIWAALLSAGSEAVKYWTP